MADTVWSAHSTGCPDLFFEHFVIFLVVQAVNHYNEAFYEICKKIREILVQSTEMGCTSVTSCQIQ